MSAPVNGVSELLGKRRAALSASGKYAGIDFIQVSPPGSAAPPWELSAVFIPMTSGASDQQRQLVSGITSANIHFADVYGVPTNDLTIITPPALSPVDGQAGGLILKLTLGLSGSRQADRHLRQPRTYLLELVNVPGVDPLFSRAPFTLGPVSVVNVDPKPVPSLGDVPQPAAEIDYLAKDFNSFKRLMLDQLSLLVPQWKERHETDIGMVLVEIMAYAADHLSYFQDSAGTEAYLGTARRRVSVRRHARLLDYTLDEGCNARAWIHFDVADESFQLPEGTPLLTAARGNDHATVGSLDEALKGEPVLFETMYPSRLYNAHNRMKFYTWGAGEAVLAEGATTATLVNHLHGLKAGDVLIFEEVAGAPVDGSSNNERRRCHPVRLSEAPRLIIDPLFNDKEVTQITWYADDALPFDMAVSDQNPAAGTGALTVALGNIVLADHGRTITEKVCLPASPLDNSPTRLSQTGLTFRAPYDPSAAGVSAVTQETSAVRPVVRVREAPLDKSGGLQDDCGNSARVWTQRRDLLSSGPFARDFVVETESDGSIYLRFGNGHQGARPAPGACFDVTYRVGNGPDGNVGPNTLRRVVLADAGHIISAVRNPLGAAGGTDPESLAEVRLNAPQAFDTQERCVTPDDYTAIAERFPGVQKAATVIRWTGSWQTAFVYVQREGGRPLDKAFRGAFLDFMEGYRIIGADVEIGAPHYVPLEIELTVYVGPHHSRNAVLHSLVETFSTSVLSDGRRGLFSRGNFTFGQPVYLSRVIAAAMRVPGVARVEATCFRRMGQAQGDEVKTGIIAVGPLEIALLDNNARALDDGTLTFDMRGGV